MIMAPVNNLQDEARGSHCGRKQWMIVDDNAGILQVVSTMTNMLAGVETRTFEEGRSALEAFRSDPEEFAAVITDLEMPGVNGLELCNALHQLNPGLKIILMTGNQSAIDDATSQLLGFAALIYKPFSPADLLRCFSQARVLDNDTPLEHLAPSRPQALNTETVPTRFTTVPSSGVPSNNTP